MGNRCSHVKTASVKIAAALRQVPCRSICHRSPARWHQDLRLHAFVELLSVALVLSGAPGLAAPAAAAPATTRKTPVFAQEAAPFPSWDVRLGSSVQDTTSRERGVANFSGEILSPKLMALQDRVANAFVPRFHLGTSTNFGRATSFAYAGLTWTLDITRSVFVEGSLGAAVNDGKTGYFVPDNRIATGCSGGLREALGVGVKLNDRWSVVTTLEHFSNGGACDRNRSLSNFGARLGYTF
jgi:lipid A 3-O-deacylase